MLKTLVAHKRTWWLSATLPFFLIGSQAWSAPATQQKDAIEARVQSLVTQMTLDEKMSLLHGYTEPAATNQGQAGYWPGLAKYGIPALRLTDGPPGVLTRRPASAPPATMALAATFSPQDARAEGEVIARTARALGQQIVLEPYINIHRDQTFNRAYNTYGEDPLLSGDIAAAMVIGIQGEGVMAQAKHFIAYDGGTDVVVGDQALHEIYLPPFEATVQVGVSSVMCSYNRINGPYACGSDALQRGVLRDQFGFKGFITSDWGATHDTDFLARGLDLEMPSALFFSPSKLSQDDKPQGPIDFNFGGNIPEEPKREKYNPRPKELDPSGLLDALKMGTVKPGDIDNAVSHILYQVIKFGWQDQAPDLSQKPDPAEAAAPILQKVAEDSAVLLKNKDDILPLKLDGDEGVALIGPGAAQLMAIGITGEKSLGHIERHISPAQALQTLAPNAKITVAVANDMDGTTIPAGVLSHNGQSGLMRGSGGADITLDHTLRTGTALPVGTNESWSGTLSIKQGGTYRLHLQVMGAAAVLKIDGVAITSTAALQRHGDVLQPGQDNVLPTTDGLDNIRVEQDLSEGTHTLSVESRGDSSGNPVQIRLAWVTPEQQIVNRAKAIETAQKAKTAVVFAWGRDKPSFHLPGDQDRLIEDIAAANPNTVVVLNVTEPVAMPWLDKVKGVVLMWFPGDEGGQATANILAGKANPAGRLPFTWPVRLEDNVANDPVHPERSSSGVDGKTRYSEGIMVGYRWFDSQKIKPQFPFGYGLSYTHFTYANLRVTTDKDGTRHANVSVKNTGERAGDEVVQLYLQAPEKMTADGQIAPQSLVGFQRVHLKAGETKVVAIALPERRFQYWSQNRSAWVAVTAPRQLAAGGSSEDQLVSTEIR